MNRQEVIDYIAGELGAAPERLWTAYPDYLVFRSQRSGKWFAIIMDIERAKLGLPGEGKIDVMNLKCDPAFIGSLLCGEGYRPAYHMNKKHWVSVLLDGSAPADEIRSLLGISFDLVD